MHHILFKDVIDEFKHWRTYKVSAKTVFGYDSHLRNFCVYLRNPDIKKITVKDILEYMDWIKFMGWDPTGLVSRSLAFRKFFEYANKQHYTKIGWDLIPTPKKVFKIPRVATAEEFNQLYSVIPEEGILHIRNKAIVRLVWATGARNSEICDLNISDLELEKKRAMIRTKKSRGVRPFRHIFWDEETQKDILAWLEIRKTLDKKLKNMPERDALFISIFTRSQGGRLKPSGMDEMFRRYSNRAGIPPVNPHSFRHAMGHRIVINSGNTWDVGNILGHSSPDSAQIYTVMVGQELSDRWEKLGRIRPQSPGPEKLITNLESAYDEHIKKKKKPTRKRSNARISMTI